MRVVFELDEIKDENDKSLLMALIVTRLAETIKQRYLRSRATAILRLLKKRTACWRSRSRARVAVKARRGDVLQLVGRSA
jgi:hypothetical protein